MSGFSIALLSGCVSSGTVQPDGTLVRKYFGYVRVEVPQAEASSPVYTSKVTTIGIRVDNGVGVGFIEDSQVVVPLDCRLVVLVANQAQLDQAINQMSLFKNMPGVCTAVSPTIKSGEKQ